MPKTKVSNITKELLLADGWAETEDPIWPVQKKLENLNPLNNSEDSDIKLVVHRMYNTDQFAILLPDGGLLNFSPASMEELKAFETMVSFYDPPF